MKKLMIAFSFVMFAGVTANAGILIDPYLSYMVSGKDDSSGASLTGTEVGARLGYSTFGFGAGLDYMASGSYTYSNNGSTSTSTPSAYGLFVSYKFPILVRGYLSYMLSAKEKSGNTDSTGTYTKVGVQYTGLPFVAIGLETSSGSFTKSTTNGTDSSISNNFSHTSVTLSLPFDL